METTKHNGHPKPVLTQTKNNTTLWIGHLKSDPNDHLAGQTFLCPSDGLLHNIQVYSSMVNEPGEVTLSLHEFEPVSNTWGSAIGQSSLSLQKEDEAQWLRFTLEPVQLQKGATYAFKLQASNAFVGLGEAVSDAKKPFSFGQAWNADTKNLKGHFMRYFSMAFKVELCA